MNTTLKLLIWSDQFAICRLAAHATIPTWATNSPFWSITRTADELSLVCRESDVPDQITAERGWRCLQVAGPLDFALTGILARLSVPLAQARISIFAISTYDTDYLLVRATDLEHAVAVLRQARCQVTER